MMTLTITHSLSLASNSTRILPWVVLAGCEATTDRSTLEMLGASYILNASSEIKSWFVDDEKFHYLHVPIEDEPTCDVRAFFAPAHKFCDDVRMRHLAGERVGLVVHCKTGMSRSSTMLLAHLMMARGVRQQVAQVTGKTDCLGAGCTRCCAAEASGGPPAASAGCAEHGMTLRDALSFIRERRPRASPNAGFMAQLIELEGQLFGGEVTIDLERYRQDRFGDVRTFCIGEIDPVVGYSGLGSGASGGPDSTGSPSAPPTVRGAVAVTAPKTPGSVKSGDSGGGGFGPPAQAQPSQPGFSSLTRMPSSLQAAGAITVPGGSCAGGTGMPPLILPVDVGGGLGSMGSVDMQQQGHGCGERPRRLSEQRTELPLGPVAFPMPPSTTRPSSSRALRGFSYSYDEEAASTAATSGSGASPATPSAARAQFRAAHSDGSGGLLSGARRAARVAGSSAEAPPASAVQGAPCETSLGSDRVAMSADRAMQLTPVRAVGGELGAPQQPQPVLQLAAMSDSPAPPAASLPALERRPPSLDGSAVSSPGIENPFSPSASLAALGSGATSSLPGIAAGPTATTRRRSVGGASGSQHAEGLLPAVSGALSPSLTGLSRPPLGGSGDVGAFALVEPQAPSGGRPLSASGSTRRLSVSGGGPLPDLSCAKR